MPKIVAGEKGREATVLSQVERLETMLAEQKRIDRMKDQFIGTVSHELRTPLTIVQASIDNFNDGLAGRLTKSQREVIELAHRNVHRLTKMINNVLDLSRLESGQAKPDCRDFDLKAVIGEVLKRLKWSGEGRHLSIAVEAPVNLPGIYGDPAMIAQALTNVIENAMRFARNKVVVKTIKPGRSVQIAVSDDGEGIPTEMMENLFDKYIQVARAAKKGEKGTGLGLAISKEIISLHKGKIWADSKIGRGTRMNILLPRHANGQ